MVMASTINTMDSPQRFVDHHDSHAYKRKHRLRCFPLYTLPTPPLTSSDSVLSRSMGQMARRITCSWTFQQRPPRWRQGHGAVDVRASRKAAAKIKAIQRSQGLRLLCLLVKSCHVA
jgi:hypothetical protein